jgi:hypothetical protein
VNQSLAYEFLAVVPTVIATGLCDSLCSIQLPDGVLIGAGQPSGNYIAIAGLTNLVVISAPESESRIQANENKSIDEVQSFAPRHVWVAGFYPQIETLAAQGAQAVIDGTVFDLLGAEADSQFQTTRLSVRTSGL